MYTNKWGTFRQHNVLWTVLLVGAAEGALLLPILLGWAHFDPNIGMVVFATVPAFAITIAQLVRTQQVQRAAYVKDFLTEFRKNGELFLAFYDLVYRFRDEIFSQVDRTAHEYISARGKVPAQDKPVFGPFERLNAGIEPGCRFYHPLLFQFSPEEKKLDGLLDYFNAIGLYVYEGLMRIEDVVIILGDYLAVIADRKIVQEYLRICHNPAEWKYDDTVGASPPYQHLQFLLEAYKGYNLKTLNRKRLETLRGAIAAKELEVAALRDKLRQPA